jgi:hypothetical protein
MRSACKDELAAQVDQRPFERSDQFGHFGSSGLLPGKATAVIISLRACILSESHGLALAKWSEMPCWDLQASHQPVLHADRYYVTYGLELYSPAQRASRGCSAAFLRTFAHGGGAPQHHNVSPPSTPLLHMPHQRSTTTWDPNWYPVTAPHARFWRSTARTASLCPMMSAAARLQWHYRRRIRHSLEPAERCKRISVHRSQCLRTTAVRWMAPRATLAARCRQPAARTSHSDATAGQRLAGLPPHLPTDGLGMSGKDAHGRCSAAPIRADMRRSSWVNSSRAHRLTLPSTCLL